MERIKRNLFYSGAFVVLCYHFYSHALISQLSRPLAPVLVFPSIDLSYQLFLASGLFHAIVHGSVLPVLHDILLLSLPLLIMLLPERPLLRVVFFVLCVFYHLSFNTIAGHHFHGFIGIVFLAGVCCFEGKRFIFLWEAARYYLLFIFVSAALWKIWRGNIFNPNHMLHILQSQHAQFFFEQPSSLHSRFLSWLMGKPVLTRLVLFSGVLLQLSFLYGFFSRNKDYLLLAGAIAFVSFNYLIMRIVSFELLILGITLLPDNLFSRSKLSFKS
ncbi:MAG: hypothetical protein RMJ53_05425 [Chitinophagales bacterium]|nr:hypothetical protein [Chitinophagales bacterium]MDW8273651.1 hypothetical protein [Chitinophagales bacterium]